jgi:tripartite-type tricarboxylate transporter receptor subunit TctC
MRKIEMFNSLGKLGAIAIVMATLSSAALAAYPDKPITMIVGFSAGGATDILARAVAPLMEEKLGARIIVVNRTGAGGEIAFNAIAAAAPDGYTIGLINSPNVLTIPIERKTNYSIDKFDLLGNVIDDPGAFTVHSGARWKTLGDLIAEAKARPGQITVGTTGVGSDDHIAMLELERQVGVKFNHIPFKGGADVRSALIGKQIDVASMNIGEGIQGAKTGSPYRNLGQMSNVRSPVAPDVPTFKELGYDVVVASLRGFAAPKGLPPEVREKLVQSLAFAVNDAAFRARAVQMFNPIRYLGPKEYEAELQAGQAEYRQLWKEMPWTEN